MNATAQHQATNRPRGNALARFGRVVADVLWQPAPDADTAALLRARYGLMGELANVDWIVTSHEVEVVTSVMERDDLSMAARALALDAFEDGRHRRFDASSAIEPLLRAHRTGSPVVGQLFNDLMRLALSDGRLRRVEHAWLVALGAKFNLSAKGIDARLRALAPTIQVAA